MYYFIIDYIMLFILFIFSCMPWILLMLNVSTRKEVIFLSSSIIVLILNTNHRLSVEDDLTHFNS